MSKGAQYFTQGTLWYTLSFPEDKVRCQYCPCCRYEEALKRYSCRLTGEWLVYPFQCVGRQCPIGFEEKEDRA